MKDPKCSKCGKQAKFIVEWAKGEPVLHDLTYEGRIDGYRCEECRDQMMCHFWPCQGV